MRQIGRAAERKSAAGKEDFSIILCAFLRRVYAHEEEEPRRSRTRRCQAKAAELFSTRRSTELDIHGRTSLPRIILRRPSSFSLIVRGIFGVRFLAVAPRGPCCVIYKRS